MFRSHFRLRVTPDLKLPWAGKWGLVAGVGSPCPPLPPRLFQGPGSSHLHTAHPSQACCCLLPTLAPFTAEFRPDTPSCSPASALCASLGATGPLLWPPNLNKSTSVFSGFSLVPDVLATTTPPSVHTHANAAQVCAWPGVGPKSLHGCPSGAFGSRAPLLHAA